MWHIDIATNNTHYTIQYTTSFNIIPVSNRMIIWSDGHEQRKDSGKGGIYITQIRILKNEKHKQIKTVGSGRQKPKREKNSDSLYIFKPHNKYTYIIQPNKTKANTVFDIRGNVKKEKRNGIKGDQSLHQNTIYTIHSTPYIS